MRVQTAFVVAAALAALVASDVLAQPGGGRGGRGFRGFGGGFGGTDRMDLLRVEKVQQNLNFTTEQQQQLTAAEEALDEQRRENRGDFGDIRNMSQEERQQAFARMRTERLNQEMAKLGEVLNDEQMKRLEEIYVQVQGASAVTDPKVAEKLNISAAQQEELQTVQGDARGRMMEQFRDMRDSDMTREELQAQREELQKQTDEQMLAVLSESQKNAFAQMKGAALELTQDDLRQARRGGRGGRGGGDFGGGRRGNRGGQGDDE